MTKPLQPPVPQAGWAYFLDLDGTLIHIAEAPDAVQVDQALVKLIGGLQVACGGALALVSGRALSDLDNLLRLPGLAMAGLHGLERRDAAGRLWIHATPPTAKEALLASLNPLADRHAGLFLEDKGLSLALHYRRAPHLASAVHRLMNRLLKSIEEPLELQPGKFVLEIKPAGVDKGTALDEFLAEPPFLARRPVFVGDDLTDEKAFARVNQLDGVSIRVGGGKTCARYRLNDVEAVRHWLGNALEAAT